MKMNYTKGKWKVIYRGLQGHITANNKIICEMLDIDSINSEDNVHLISASPDLYEALKAIRENIGWANDIRIIDQMKNALLKAEGK